jgi:hypothetical protein
MARSCAVIELQHTLQGLRPLHFTSDDVYHVFKAILKYNAEGGYSMTPYANAMQDFFSTLPAEHELCRSLSAREAFGKQVRDLWEAHCAMQTEPVIEGVELYGMKMVRPYG